MKSLFCVIMLFCLLSTSASADTSYLSKYNGYAEILHAPMLDENQVKVTGNYHFYPLEKMTVVFETAINGGIRTGFIFMDDDSGAADFLISCITMNAFFGKFSYNYYGTILQMFLDTRMDYETVPFNIGIDSFQILTSDKGKYSFVYMNNDAKLNE